MEELEIYFPHTQYPPTAATLGHLRQHNNAPFSIVARVDVLKLAIYSFAEALIHLWAAIGKCLVATVQYGCYGVSPNRLLLQTRDHVHHATRSFVAALAVPLPALLNPSFALTSYRWLSLEQGPGAPKQEGIRYRIVIGAAASIALGIIGAIGIREMMRRSAVRWKPEDESTRCCQRIAEIYQALREREQLPSEINDYQCLHVDTQNFGDSCEAFKKYQVNKLFARINAKLRFEWQLFNSENCWRYSARVSEETRHILDNL